MTTEITTTLEFEDVPLKASVSGPSGDGWHEPRTCDVEDVRIGLDKLKMDRLRAIAFKSVSGDTAHPFSWVKGDAMERIVTEIVEIVLGDVTSGHEEKFVEQDGAECEPDEDAGKER